jgi:hypothetical protein
MVDVPHISQCLPLFNSDSNKSALFSRETRQNVLLKASDHNSGPQQSVQLLYVTRPTVVLCEVCVYSNAQYRVSVILQYCLLVVLETLITAVVLT